MIEMRRHFSLLLAVMAVLFAVVAPAAATAAERQTAGVIWHGQQAGMGKSGPVTGASAQIVRNDNGIAYRLSTSGLEQGNAYTLWLVVINNPSICAADPCTAAEIFNPASRSQVRFGAGHVAGSSGKGTFAGHVSVGPLSGWLSNGSLEDARVADIHLVINDHGPALPEFMPGMIHSYRGGCSDASPFPAIFPATALADGEVGPNICRLYQAATFSP
ncbi:MAG TPA: hypothetical protein VMS99_01340 [Acidimicrobiia bacterium]|nr:hypothetical protein [Acidimicrobiia bacterium]